MNRHEQHHDAHDHDPAAHACVHGHETEHRAASVRDEALDEARRGTGLTRRSILAGLGLAAGGGVLAPTLAAAQPKVAPRGQVKKEHNAELVLLGTRAGPPVVANHKGAASALVVNGATYVIDCGRSSVTQFAEAGLRFDSIKAFFLTHLHADHLADYYNFFMLGGHIPNPFGDHIAGPTPIYGPGAAGGLQPKFGGGTAPTVNPSDRTPGTAQMTESLHAAYAYSTNVFLRDMNIRDIRDLMRVHEIALPSGVNATYLNTAPSMDPFLIYQDENVTVHATLVPHGPVFPAYAFRFDTEYGSVTFSGDTRHSDNLIAMAQDTDILVHEAIGVKGASLPSAVLDHMLQSHVPVDQVGAIAQAARAKRLVLAHYADLVQQPIDVNDWRRQAQAGYTLGKATVGLDLQKFALGK
ncbi:Ribonuclease BN, tRNA processing enzyme [Raineyella antarctica]|uniref:Ribonuclease BN, tRNA processing enzyme n=1 Tax=Raineyella antarctica TaxID=1577474 RepID=A0A1G6IG44_9ACTN|nr:MBL fold metallo-hydrolase [Raineyella antarctica]SDC05527.1 Ribonuclease BN, tRNA processing enzyme [Raineyella antarctica]